MTKPKRSSFPREPHRRIMLPLLTLLFLCGIPAPAQVYSPRVLLKGQIDTTDTASLVKGIYGKSNAKTPREKAEAIWRFFLTDGRFVAPGFWYHIAGWAYEEPQGEVLDPVKLMNSYGFGLCYQIAPLLEAAFEAGGFEDARVWFLTGHTVTEVLYDGAYHYYDSDMLGYTTVGNGDPKTLPVASVSQIARDGSIMLDKLASPTTLKRGVVDYPWYPADLKEAAIGGLAEAFTTQDDNWLFPSKRYPEGHAMSFVLRRGERMIRYFEPEDGRRTYLPFKNDGTKWSEFPAELSQWAIRTEDGPKSQKDDRRWATGVLEYSPALEDPAAYAAAKPWARANLRRPTAGAVALRPELAGKPGRAVFDMRSPYVLIDAELSLTASLNGKGQSLEADVSADQGLTWHSMGRRDGPYEGKWQVSAPSVATGTHGALSVVGGKYSYLVRLTLVGPSRAAGPSAKDISIRSRFQLNPRTLPALSAGANELNYVPGPPTVRREWPVTTETLTTTALKSRGVRLVTESGQSILWADGSEPGDVILELSNPSGAALAGFEAGARFLDLRNGIAPDKLTAETRPTKLASSSPAASLSWATRLAGEYKPLWTYDPFPKLRDGETVARMLHWPEVDQKVRDLPPGTHRVYVKYSIRGMGLDTPRIATIVAGAPAGGRVVVTHQWTEGGSAKEHVESVPVAASAHGYTIGISSGAAIRNKAIVLSSPK